MNTDMRKFESSQKDESRAQSAGSSKAYRKRRAFYCQTANVRYLLAMRQKPCCSVISVGME